MYLLPALCKTIHTLQALFVLLQIYSAGSTAQRELQGVDKIVETTLNIMQYPVILAQGVLP